MSKRFWEIDFCRGIAVVLMIIFNYLFALNYFGLYTAGGGWLFWWLFPRLIAGGFIFIAGISLTISYRRNRRLKKLSRGGKIFGLGLLITIATYLFTREPVLFGILHMIGLSVMVGQLFIRFNRINAALGFVLIVAGIWLENIRFDFPWLLWLGFMPAGFSTLDYFPLLPWFGVFLMGMAAGRHLYKNGKRAFRISNRNEKLITFFGRHSLITYMLHIPLLIVVLYASGLAVL